MFEINKTAFWTNCLFQSATQPSNHKFNIFSVWLWSITYKIESTRLFIVCKWSPLISLLSPLVTQCVHCVLGPVTVDKWHRAFCRACIDCICRFFIRILVAFTATASSLHVEGEEGPGTCGAIRRGTRDCQAECGEAGRRREGEQYFPPSWNQSGSGEVHGDEDWRWRIGDTGHRAPGSRIGKQDVQVPRRCHRGMQRISARMAQLQTWSPRSPRSLEV